MCSAVHDICPTLKLAKLILVVNLAWNILKSPIVDAAPCRGDTDEAFQCSTIDHINIRDTSELVSAGSHHMCCSCNFRRYNSLMVMGDVGSFSQTIVFHRHFFLIVNDDPFPNLKITPTPFILHNCFHHWGCPFGTSPKCWSLLIRQHLCNFFCGVSAQCSEEDIFYGLSLFFLDDETALYCVP